MMPWDEALRQVLNDYREAEFAWGQRDCFQFVSAYVLARTGIDHARAFSYSSEPEAMELIETRRSVEGLIETCLGPSRPFASEGDVVVCHVENLHAPGISNGSYVWAYVKDKKLCRMKLESIQCGWSI